MTELVLDNIVWKKGEQGIQKFIIYDSNGVDARDITGKTIAFKFWKSGSVSNKGSGFLTITDGPKGEAYYALASTDTDTVDEYLGELVEDPSGANVKIRTFKVSVLETAPA